MAEEQRKICCMFDYKNAGDAVKNRNLIRISTLRDSSRRDQALCQCKLCGAYVLYDYEEIANLYGGWDNADIFERFYPVEVEKEESEGEEPEYTWSFISGARWISGHNLEDDVYRRYWYEDD